MFLALKLNSLSATNLFRSTDQQLTSFLTLLSLVIFVSINKRAADQLRIKASLEFAEQQSDVDWVKVDPAKLQGTYMRTPERSDLSADINEQLIVELYSK